jgi:hypothetical protein
MTTATASSAHESVDRVEEPVRLHSADHPFRELDDLVLDLKGLVAVSELRRRVGAPADELEMYRRRIDNVRDRLARYASEALLPQVA